MAEYHASSVASTARRKRNVSDEGPLAGEDVLSLSFLDVLSCGLGAAIYLFLIFSIMPHLGTSLGASEERQSSKGYAEAIGIQSIHSLVRNSAVSIDVRIANVEPDVFPVDPWNGTLPNQASRTKAVKLPSGPVLLSTHVSGRRIKRVLNLTLDDAKLKSTGKLHIELNVLVGGSSTNRSWDADLQTAHKNRGQIAQIDLLSGDVTRWIILMETSP
jgi:hypothetical protein